MDKNRQLEAMTLDPLTCSSETAKLKEESQNRNVQVLAFIHERLVHKMNNGICENMLKQTNYIIRYTILHFLEC